MPFTIDQFFNVFDAYNAATGYASIILSILAITAALGLAGKFRRSYRFTYFILAVLWLWAGIVYHFYFFADVNPVAWLFGLAFLFEAAVLAGLGVGMGMRVAQAARLKDAPHRIAAWALIWYSLSLYPLITAVTGHVYPRAPVFGAPCPVTIFTLGVLVLCRAPAWAAIVPVLWSIIGSGAAVLFGVYADLGLAAAVIIWIASYLAGSRTGESSKEEGFQHLSSSEVGS
jgi:hypothetical protein